ncbi:hypothetical protein [Actinomyces trachealis]|uniref:hypothetical protein n=1 Tax=Actinomyces trachealis TaxID=2763540 RepID=UPI0018928AB0|nr:hypothetical protein [Actinomyces trachealis]
MGSVVGVCVVLDWGAMMAASVIITVLSVVFFNAHPAPHRRWAVGGVGEVAALSTLSPTPPRPGPGVIAIDPVVGVVWVGHVWHTYTQTSDV